MWANLSISKTIKSSYALLLAERPDLIRDFASASDFIPASLKRSHHDVLVLFQCTAEMYFLVIDAREFFLFDFIFPGTFLSNVF